MKIEFNKVYFEEKGDIGYIIINDPPANKMTTLFFKEFCAIVRQHVAQSRVKGIIITGTGRHFSSGAHIEELKEMVATQSLLDKDGVLVAYPIWFHDNRTTFNFFDNLNIPVISAIKGFCIGSGFELALSSHIRICGNGSRLGSPESTFGLLPGATGSLRYMKLIGLGKTLELVLSGEIFTEEDAMEMELIDGIVNKKDTLSYCEELMKFIIDNNPIYSKQNIKEYIKSFNENYKK